MSSVNEGRGERGEGHIGVCIRGIYFTMLGDMESNDRRNVLAHNESLKLLSTISLSTINSIIFSKLLFCQNSFPGSPLSLNPRWRLATLWSLWIGLPPS